jgi:hypothetical protein
MIVDLLNETHRGRYTTLYVPMDFKNVCNMGYFFLDVADARCASAWAALSGWS